MVELMPVQRVGVPMSIRIGCQESWSGGLGNGTVAGGAGGAEWVGLCLKDVPVGVTGSCFVEGE